MGLKDDAQKLIEEYEAYSFEVDKLSAARREALELVIPPEIKAHIAQVEAESAKRMAPVLAHLGVLEDRIREMVLANKATVRSRTGNYSAQYRRPMKRWDSKKLEQLARTIYQVYSCKVDGAPSVHIVRAKHLRIPDATKCKK